MFWILAIVLTLLPSYTYHGAPVDHLDITYECDPVLQQAVRIWTDASGLRDGGCSDNPDITIEVESPWKWPKIFAYASQENGRCRVVQRFPDMGVLLVAHEVGHCLGAGHSTDPNSLMFATCCTAGLGSDDLAFIQSLYGQPEPKFRAVVQMTAAD